MYVKALVIAALIAVSVSAAVLCRRGNPPGKVLLLLTVSVVAFFIGSRLFHFLINLHLYRSGNLDLFAIQAVGFALYGGMMAAAGAVWLMCRLLAIPFWDAADAAACGFAPAIVIMRVGCLINGCCFGKPTNLPWGISYPLGSQVHFYQIQAGISLFPVPVHPTQIYEMIFALAAFLIAIYLSGKWKRSGVLAVIFTAVFTLGRWMNYYFRENITGSSYYDKVYPEIYLVIFLLAVICLINIKFIPYKNKEK